MIGVLAQASTTDFDIFVQTFFKAAALGSLYSLLALGFVLVPLRAVLFCLRRLVVFILQWLQLLVPSRLLG